MNLSASVFGKYFGPNRPKNETRSESLEDFWTDRYAMIFARDLHMNIESLRWAEKKMVHNYSKYDTIEIKLMFKGEFFRSNLCLFLTFLHNVVSLLGSYTAIIKMSSKWIKCSFLTWALNIFCSVCWITTETQHPSIHRTNWIPFGVIGLW